MPSSSAVGVSQLRPRVLGPSRFLSVEPAGPLVCRCVELVRPRPKLLEWESQETPHPNFLLLASNSLGHLPHTRHKNKVL